MIITKETPLRTVRELGAECSMCCSCCKRGSGLLVPEDIPKIAKFLGVKEDELKEKYLRKVDFFNTECYKPRIRKGGKPFGECIFLDSKEGCSIHIVKPLQCAITNCGENSEQAIQWIYLNYFVNPEDPESVRQWASYLKNRDWVIEGGNLQDIIPDKELLGKILSYEKLR